MIKVLSITNNFPSIIDGVGDYTYNLHSHLSKETDHFIVCSRKPEIINFVKKKSLDEHVYPIISKWSILSIFKIIILARKKKINIVHLQYVNYSYNKYGLPIYLIILPLLCKFFGIKFTIFFHEVSIRIFGYGIKLFFLGLFQRVIAFILSHFSFKVFVNSTWSMSLLWPFKNKTYVLPIPSNFENEIEKSLKSKKENFELRIVSFSNRCDFNLLKAILHLKETIHPNIVLLLIGSSTNQNKKQTIKNIELLNIKDSVFIYDNIDPYQFSDILVNSTIYIQLEKVVGDFKGGISTKSGAMMAAMQSGLPIISTVGDMTDLTYFKNLENIFLIKDNKSISIINAVNYILSEKNILHTIGINARNTYLQTNNFFLHSNLLLDFLKS